MPVSFTRVVVAVLALVLTAGVRVPASRVTIPEGLPCQARALSASDSIASAEVARSEWAANRGHVHVATASTASHRLRARREADQQVGRSWAPGRTLVMHVAGASAAEQRQVWRIASAVSQQAGIRLVAGEAAHIRVQLDPQASCRGYLGTDAMIAVPGEPTVVIGGTGDDVSARAAGAFRLAFPAAEPRP